jgi:peptidyl-prolyl cis-trans isomerase SurA
VTDAGTIRRWLLGAGIVCAGCSGARGPIGERGALEAAAAAAVSASPRDADATAAQPRPLDPPAQVVHTSDAPKDIHVAPASALIPATNKPESDDGRIPLASAKRDTPSGSDPSKLLSNIDPQPGLPAAQTAARVGDSVITFRELRLAIAIKMLDGTHWTQMSRDEQAALARGMTENLIHRTLILQDIRKSMKDPKQWGLLMDYAQKKWDDDELPRLVRKLQFEDRYALEQSFEKRGISLEDWADHYKLELVSREYLIQKVRERVDTPTLPRMLEYYQAHLKDYDRPAAVTWREIRVPVATGQNLATTRRKANEILARLSQGADFATEAKTQSDGATATAGGLWKDTTLPAQTTVDVVNQALASLPPGATSGILEGSESLHIVRIEARRAAGPARFVEVQKTISDALYRENMDRAIDDFLDKCRGQTIVVVAPILGGTPSADASVQPASRTAQKHATPR